MSEQKPPYNAADEGQVKVRKRKADLQAERAKNDLISVMQTDYGRRFLWNLISDAGVFSNTFNTNALTMSNNEGRRNEGCKLLVTCELASKELFLLMWREAIVQKEIDNA